MTASCKDTKHPLIPYPLDAMEDIAEELLQFQITSWDWLRVLLQLHCRLSFRSSLSCFLPTLKGIDFKASPALLGLSFLQNQAIDWWCLEEEAVSNNGTLEMNYSLAIWQWGSHYQDRWSTDSLWHAIAVLLILSPIVNWNAIPVKGMRWVINILGIWEVQEK